MKDTINMIRCSASEVLHLFEVMNRYGTKCELELQTDGNRDPILGISKAFVKSEYLKGTEGDTVVICLGEAEFGFDKGVHFFSKDISESQIMICVAGQNLCAWFNSEGMSPEAIAEANSYEERITYKEEAKIDSVMIELSEQEATLIKFLRSLEFDDLLDASDSLIREADQQQLLAISSQGSLDRIGAKGFRERAENLRGLAEALSIANNDYRNHVDPTE